MPTLSDPIALGAIACPNRVLMAPLTRGRATREHVPTPIMAEYYAQRAGAGLIISEATGISRQGLGWPYAPGIWNEEQVAGWRPVTQAVREAGGRIICQLWHMGRLVHPSFLDGEAPVSASATTAPGEAHTYDGKQAYAEARALAGDEIPGIVKDYARAAGFALAAGFDGVQIHGANGYLIDQFLRDGTNSRDDDYGGSVGNRVRLLREVTEAVITVAGAERTAVRLSPGPGAEGLTDSDPEATFTAAAAALDELGVAFLELREPTRANADTVDPISAAIRKVFHRPLVLNSNYDRERAEAALNEERADAIAFGRRFIANPDLVDRFAADAPLNPDERKAWYGRGPEGYTDYPALERAPA